MTHVFLNPNSATNLRNTINEDVDFSYKHVKERNKKNPKLYPAWNRICALMDRIQDTAEHINHIQFQDEIENRSAFSFLDFMNHSSVLIDCIYEIARIYEIDMSQYEDSCDIFHNPGKDNGGSDKKYFEYLRSLCSVHPINTDRHKSYQDGDYECCPFVCWGREILGTGEHSVIAVVYTDDESSHKEIVISMREINDYLVYVYSFIDSVIIPGIEAFKERCREEFRKQTILPVESFTDYVAYLENLKEEARKRYSDDSDYYIDSVLRFFSVRFKEKKNRIGLAKLQNAIKLAVHFYHVSLQNMSWTGYENTGIKYPAETDSTFLLECLLHMRNTSKKAMLYGYEIGTFHELYNEDNSFYVYAQIENARPFLELYVSLDEAKTRIETYILTQIALYADALRNRNLINQNIPNDLKYRFRRLNEKSLDKLRRPQIKKGKSNDQSLDHYRKIVQEYLGDSDT